MPRNDFEIIDGIVRIFMKRRNGDILVTLVDEADLGILEGYRLFPVWGPRTRSWYARARLTSGFSVHVQKLIMSTPEGMVTDHWNHDTLDNRRENLRVVTQTVNALNRHRANSDNKSSGIRGVHWDANSGKWKARIKMHGVSKHLGLFTDKESAASAVSSYLSEVAHA